MINFSQKTSSNFKSNLIYSTHQNLLQFGFLVLFTAIISISAQAANFQVTTLADNESDGCNTNQCTLREAVTDANSNLTADTVTFQSGLTGVIVLNGSHILINSDVTINGPGARILSISGDHKSRVFVVSNISLTGITVEINNLTVTGGSSQLLDINGSLIGDGGGILNAGRSTLNLTDVNVTGNSAASLGGGIATRALVLALLATTTTNITRSTINNNTSLLGGGGISNLGTDIITSAVTTIINSTVSNNTCLAEGGGISNAAATLNLTNNTISNNNSTVAGGGVVNVAGALVGTVRLRNTIIAQNTAVVGTNLISSDVLGIFNPLGNNLIGNNLNATASFAASVTVGGPPTPNLNGDIVGSIAVGFQPADPKLGGLQNNGGQTNTRLPLAGSPAINNGNNCVTTATCLTYNTPTALTVEQRGAGFPRQVGSSVDIGATESPAAQPATFTVTTLADDETDGCAVNQCTLREAIVDANNDVDTNEINFQTGLTGTIILSMGQLVVSSNMSINGPGARVITVNGNAASRVFLVATPILGGDFTATISGLTITNGKTLPVVGVIGDGGGILNGALLGVISGKSTLNLVEVAVLNNEATSIGGGIATRLGAETNIERSLIAGNTCNALPLPTGDVGGGGLSNAALSTTTISNSTVTNNTSLAAGGGILNAAGIVHSTNNTISHNKSVLLGGGVVSLVGVIPPLGVTYLRNTIIAKNDALFTTNIISSDVLGVLGSFHSLGHNLIGNNLSAELTFQASLYVTGVPQPNVDLDLVGNVVIANQIIDPLLGNLLNNGGPTDTRLPLYLSPAVNAGDNCVLTNTCAVNPFGRNPHTAYSNEQRGAGYPRLNETAVEIGAVEVLAPLSAGTSVSGHITDGNGRAISRVTVSITNASGNTRTILTNGFGYFRFENLQSGETVIVQANHKQYFFTPRVLTLSEDVTDLHISSESSEPTTLPDVYKTDDSTGKLSHDF